VMTMATTSSTSKTTPPPPIHRPRLSGEVPEAMVAPPPVWLQRTIGGVSALAGLVALGGFGLGLAEVVSGRAGPGAFWMMLFQLCAVVACVMGVLAGAGRFRSGPAMTPLIVSGVLLVAATLSEPALIRSGMPSLRVLSIPLRPFALVEVVFALTLGGLSVLVVLLRKPKRTIPMTLIGLALVAPAMGAAVSFLLPPVRAVLADWSPILLTVVVIGVLGVAGVLLSVGSQFIIRALEIGIEEGLAEAESGSGPGPA